MSDNKIWTTITMEFDTVAQRGEITNQFVKAAIAGLGLTYKVKVQEIKLPKTKSIVGVTIRYPSDLTEAQVAALIAAMQGIFGSWISSHAMDQLFLQGGGIDEASGLVLAYRLPYTTDPTTYKPAIMVTYATPDHFGDSGAGEVVSGASANIWSYIGPNSNPLAVGTALIFNATPGQGEGLPTRPATITVPAASAITIKDAAGNTLVLPARNQDIVVTPYDVGGDWAGMRAFYIDQSGRLYLCQAADANAAILGLSYTDAVAGGAW